MSNIIHRFRYDRSTKHSLAGMSRLEKLGKIISIRGYRWKPKNEAHNEAVLVKGENGSIRFGGFLWGYNGEGPRGLTTLLRELGFGQATANEITKSQRNDTSGVDWEIHFLNSDCAVYKGRESNGLCYVIKMLKYERKKEKESENWAYLVSKS